MGLPTAAEREEVEDLAADPEPDPSPTRAPDPTPEPPAPSSTTSRSASTSSTQPTGVPNARQRAAVEETAADPSPAPEADPSPDQNEPTRSGTSGNTETESMVQDPIRNPDAAFREAAGASSGATGSEILASGGSLVAAARSITGSGSAGGSPSGGTVRRLVFSGATDAPSDIISKMQGKGDPNPGHTTPAGANSTATQAKNAAENATQSIASAIPGVDAGSSSTFMAVAAAAVVGTVALVAGAVLSDGDGGK